MGRKKGRPSLTTAENRVTISVRLETQQRIKALGDRTGQTQIEIADRLINAALDAEEGDR